MKIENDIWLNKDSNSTVCFVNVTDFYFFEPFTGFDFLFRRACLALENAGITLVFVDQKGVF